MVPSYAKAEALSVVSSATSVPTRHARVYLFCRGNSSRTRQRARYRPKNGTKLGQATWNRTVSVEFCFSFAAVNVKSRQDILLVIRVLRWYIAQLQERAASRMQVQMTPGAAYLARQYSTSSVP